MEIFKSFFKFVKSRGVSDKFPEANHLTEMLNIMSLFMVIGALVFLQLANFVSTTQFPDVMIAFLVAPIYGGLILLHHFHKIKEARLYYSIVIPWWYVILMLFNGGYFGQDVAFLTIVSLTFLHYNDDKPLRLKLVLYNGFLFIFSTIYISFCEPILGVNEYPFDETVVFLFSIGWMYILYIFHEEKMKSFINKLDKKNEELKEKSSDLKSFTYIASHDLKSPLNNINNFLLLMEKDLDNNNYNNLNTYLDFTRTSADQMNELIDGVNAISTNNSQEDKSEWKHINLNQTLKKVINNLGPEIEERNGTIDKVNVLPLFLCNEADFVIIFQNLIQNGLKYNESNTPNIRIENKTSEHLILLEFTDNGIGISDKYYDQIFEYFKRLHNQNKYKGTGLGLGLCKKLVSKYHGSIEVQSEMGKYSKFIITIPIKKESENFNVKEMFEYSQAI